MPNTNETKQTAKAPNAWVTTTSVKQEANEILGSKEKSLYYLLIRVGDKVMTINVGQKTHDSVKELTDKVTKIQMEEPKK